MDWEGFFTHYRKPGFIPGYEIVNKLGSGVFGEVYKARKESIGKFYAIKFLKVSDEKISEAIFKELDTLRYFAQIDHPNLVSIEDQGEVMGIPYIVMGYGGDQTLKKRLHDGRLDPAICRAIFRQICEGVAALHDKSIIHFDLKPANIFMKGDHARVGDYGLSKLVSESHNTMSIGRGTPYYMAPEMLRRRGDHQSDIYSLGVILYEMLTGDVPFKGDSEWEVLRKHENEPVHLPAELSEPNRTVISRAMQKEPSARFQSVREMIQAFEGDASSSFVTPVSVPVAPASAAPRAVVPPPLPKRDRGATRGEARRRMRAVVDRVTSERGEGADRARQLYQQRTTAGDQQAQIDGSDQSFHSEFDAGASQAGDFVDAVPIEPPAAPAANAPLRNKERGFFGWIFWALTIPFVLVFRGLGAFFRNFFRYVVVLAITAGLAIVIHGLVWGWDFAF